MNMNVSTSRFGSVEIKADDILLFKNGLIGFEDCQHWVILADAENPAIAWLQSMQRPEIAMPVVSPRRFVAQYQVRVDHQELDSLQLTDVDSAHVLCLVGKNASSLTMNLRAPIVVNLERKLGCQVLTKDDQAIQHEFADLPINLRRTA